MPVGQRQHRLAVGDVGLEEGEGLVVAQRLQPGELQDRVVVVAEIVDADHRLAARQQGARDVRSDEPGGTGDEDGHGKGLRTGNTLQKIEGPHAYNVSFRDETLKRRRPAGTGAAVGKRLFASAARSRLQAARFCRYRAYMSVREGAMPLAVTLDDKYLLESGRVYLTGTQALVRLPMMQRQRDLAAGLNTGWLHFRLSRLAAGRLRPGAVAGQALHQEEPHRVPARRQRGPRGHRPVGHPADPPLSRRALRWRVRHVVRQGSGRRPLGRRAEARQLCRHLPARRHRGAGRRRPHGQVVDHGPSERARLHGRRHPGHPCRQRPGISRFRPACLRDVALLRACGSPSRC